VKKHVFCPSREINERKEKRGASHHQKKKDENEARKDMRMKRYTRIALKYSNEKGR